MYSNFSNASITVDRVNGKFFEGRDILQVIREHICSNTVKVKFRGYLQLLHLSLSLQIRDRVYRQKQGIPQGSFLSTLLCSLFYGQFDRDSGILEFPPEDLVLRYVDDFLIISPCKDRLIRLVKFLQDGFPEFGISINSSKTRFSFPDANDFSWCGLRFNPETLDVSPDYSNFEYTSKNEFAYIFLFLIIDRHFRLHN